MAPGPQTDYAFVNMASPTSAQYAAFTDANAYWWSLCARVQYHRGPIRGAKVNNDRSTAESNAWKPQDTISWWADGTSNQLVFGEKHVPSSDVGKCTGNESGDCSYLSGEIFSTTNYSRTFVVGSIDPPDLSNPSRFLLGNPGWEWPLMKGNERAGSPNPAIHWLAFGSSHPGVCNFLIGDGSVHTISNTTPVNPILIALSLTNDGTAVALP